MSDLDLHRGLGSTPFVTPWFLIMLVTHPDDSRGSKAFSGVCMCVCVCVCVCPRDKTTITKLVTSRVLAHQLLLGQSQTARSHGHKVQKHIEGDRAAGVIELCTLSSAQPLDTHADFSVLLSVCLSVCLFVCSITKKRMIPKFSNLI